jgi:hypothetical protein
MGTKKALCIGINYIGSSDELHGCINDAMNLRNLLMSAYNVPSTNITLLTDGPSSLPLFKPYKSIITEYMKQLVKGAKKGDTLFISFSGHGSIIKGTEDSIYPLDYQKNGVIDNLQLHSLLVATLPVGVTLVGLMDCCQSGTLFNLPYTYQSPKVGEINHKKIKTIVQSASKAKVGDVFLFSGCRDNQSSWDTADNGVPCGAMTDCFVKTIQVNSQVNYVNLLLGIRVAIEALINGTSQIPQLSTNNKSHIFNMVTL